MPKVLIVDDHLQITKILSDYVQKEGYQTVVVHDGEAAIDVFFKDFFDLILLDVMMPKKDGFEVCREIRKKSNVPIIMITARGEDFEKIMGLDIGADDYIVKPFSPDEVMARVRAMLRRITRTPENDESQKKLVFSNLTVCLDDCAVFINDVPVVLTKKEIEILWLLADNRGKVFSRENLLDSLWGYDYFGDNRTVDSHIKRLRSKLDVAEHPAWQIKTIWGMGYKFEETAYET